MDFQKLAELLPKQSITWTVDDIVIWLTFIGLDHYAARFKQASVDGSCLSDLSEEDIECELKISSKIIRRKIMTWINQGIPKYDKFLVDQTQLLQQTSISKKTYFSPVKPQVSFLQKQQKFSKWQQLCEFQQSMNERKSRKRETIEPEKRQINELVIRQCQSSIYNCYSLKQHGGMIGKNSKNEIHIVDQSVSRVHAQFQYENGEYYLRDKGSCTGTFIRICEKTQLYHGQIIEMGSNQFYIDLSNSKILAMKIIEGPNFGEPVAVVSIKGKVNIGRKGTNQINFPQDQHLSNIHSTIFSVQGIWYIEDLGTTNGTWIRLSPEGIESPRYLIENEMQFKLGSNLTYECRLSNYNRKTEKERSDKCQLCKTYERDCIFIPCKHNVSCYRCTQMNELSHCISCGSAIIDTMKIYKV